LITNFVPNVVLRFANCVNYWVAQKRIIHFAANNTIRALPCKIMYGLN